MLIETGAETKITAAETVVTPEITLAETLVTDEIIIETELEENTTEQNVDEVENQETLTEGTDELDERDEIATIDEAMPAENQTEEISPEDISGETETTREVTTESTENGEVDVNENKEEILDENGWEVKHNICLGSGNEEISESDINETPIIQESVLAAEPEPIILEKLTINGKLITVSSPTGVEEGEFLDVPVRIGIPEIFKVGEESKIKIQWKNNDNQNMDFQVVDEDDNGYLDHVEWIVPHLSTQTFEIIFISSALRLDAEKNILEDIYDLVKFQDQIFAEMLNGQYVRVTFEHSLDNGNDITLYAKPTTVGQSVTVEVYTVDGQLLTTFPLIENKGKYKIILSGLSAPTDVFDLKIIGDLSIDQIIDPPANAYWVGGSGNWSDATNHWATSSGGSPGVGNAPDATSNVIFDANSGSATTIVNIDTSATVGSFTINCFTGTIAQNAALTITNSGGQSGNYSQVTAATFTANSPATNTFSATGSFSSTSALLKGTLVLVPRLTPI